MNARRIFLAALTTWAAALTIGAAIWVCDGMGCCWDEEWDT